MRRISFLLYLFLSISYSASAQYNFILSSNEIIECKGYKKKKKGTYILRTKQEAVEYDAAEVFGYYETDGEAFIYSKAFRKNSADSSIYDLMPKLVEGRINVYKRVRKTRTQNGTMHFITFYLEKDDQWMEGFMNSIGKEFIHRDNIKEIISDDPELIKQLESKDFKYRYHYVLNLIRKYNWNHPIEIDDENGNTNLVAFRRDIPSKLLESIKLTINGKEEDFANRESFELELPENKFSEICISNGEEEVCDRIRASPYVRKVYAFGYNKKDGLIIYRDIKNY